MAHYVFLSKIKEKHLEKKVWDAYKRLTSSYEFINNLSKNKFENYGFCTSLLALSEIFHAIIEEYCCMLMYQDGVPFSSWHKAKYRFKKKNEKTDWLLIDMLDFVDTFISNDVEETNKIILLQDFYDYSLISDLVINKNCEVHDAVLLSTASHNDVKYFVTKDHDLRHVEFDKVKIVAPEIFNEKLGKSRKKSQKKVRSNS